ncbi:hypothetical protein CEXT_218841 [Caerostris extrusa]|uniref:Uncharacterized protein n=1 Tax=Caerostris extrusa TaxID=172846 RepID=A0AAV4VA83_CAEEX|nr:hypothetical protein CEXT_218841 [Caerostris extrusa]
MAPPGLEPCGTERQSASHSAIRPPKGKRVQAFKFLFGEATCGTARHYLSVQSVTEKPVKISGRNSSLFQKSWKRK